MENLFDDYILVTLGFLAISVFVMFLTNKDSRELLGFLATIIILRAAMNWLSVSNSGLAATIVGLLSSAVGIAVIWFVYGLLKETLNDSYTAKDKFHVCICAFLTLYIFNEIFPAIAASMARIFGTSNNMVKIILAILYFIFMMYACFQHVLPKEEVTEEESIYNDQE